MFSKRAFAIILIFSFFVFLAFQGVEAAVELLYFIATSQDDGILLEWETGNELDNAGFFVTRSTSAAGSYETISEFIDAEGEGIGGAEYDFLDTDVTSGVLYYYILEAIDINQAVETHGPITGTFSSQPTNTPTPTITSTPTRTNTPTGTKKTKTATPTVTRTPTKTRTSVPTRTNSPVPPTHTPTAYTATPTPSATFTITPSPTLQEAPNIILELPTNTNTPLPTLEIAPPLPTPTQTPSSPLNRLGESNIVLVVGAICLLVLVWATIAVAVFIYIQRRNA
jgi:hypothetical protein